VIDLVSGEVYYDYKGCDNVEVWDKRYKNMKIVQIENKSYGFEVYVSFFNYKKLVNQIWRHSKKIERKKNKG